MTLIFTELLALFQSLFTGAPSFVTDEICMWLAVAGCIFLVMIPFLFIIKIIRYMSGV